MKDIAGAKQRLAGVLSQAERAELALAMLTDVIGACREAACFDQVAVISADSEVAWHARDLGAKPLAEPATLSGLNDSLRFGQRYLARRMAADELVMLPADVPLVQASDLRAVVDALGAAERSVVIVRARDGGTNALAMCPAEAMDMRFGPHSADAHLAAAQEAGIAAQELPLERLQFDVDSRADVDELRGLAVGAATRAWVDGRR